MNENKSSLGKQMIQYGLFAILTKAIPFLLFSIFTRILSQEEIGLVDAIELESMLLAIGIELSLSSALARFYYDSKNKGELKELISTVFMVIISVGFLVFFGTLIFTVFYAEDFLGSQDYGMYLVYGACFAIFIPILGCSDIILRMEGEVLKFNIANIFQTISYSVVAIWGVFFQRIGVDSLFIAMTCMYTVKMGVHYYWLKNKISMKFSITYFKKCLNYSVPLMPAVGVNILNRQVDRYLIIYFFDLSLLGVYAIAAKFVLFIQLITQAFRLAWDPYAISIIDNKDRNDFYVNALNRYVWIMSLIAMIIIAMSKEIITFLAPTEYHHGLIIIPWLLGALILHTSGSITNLGVLISKRTYINSYIALIGFIVNAILTYILLPMIGLLGASIGSFVASAIFTFCLGYISTKELKVNFEVNKIVIAILLYVITSSILIYWVSSISDYFVNFVVRIVTLVIYVIILSYIFNLRKELIWIKEKLWGT